MKWPLPRGTIPSVALTQTTMSSGKISLCNLKIGAILVPACAHVYTSLWLRYRGATPAVEREVQYTSIAVVEREEQYTHAGWDIYITLHYITLHYTTLHYITLHDMT